MKRYIKEYSSAKSKSINENALMQDEYKRAALKRIDKALNLNTHGYITDDETISMILNCFSDIK